MFFENLCEEVDAEAITQIADRKKILMERGNIVDFIIYIFETF